MNYRIQELDEFFVVGQDIELTTSQRRNLQISTSFWRQFNINLKKIGRASCRERVSNFV